MFESVSLDGRVHSFGEHCTISRLISGAYSAGRLNGLTDSRLTRFIHLWIKR
jgi:hypothetical protein